MTIKFVQGKKHKFAVIEKGEADITVALHHGGPGYYWKESEISQLHKYLDERSADVKLQAVMSRGCGVGQARTESNDLWDDSLLKRAEDLSSLPQADIVMAHSLGALPVLAAVMEGYIKPKAIVLVAPNSASLGEQEYWFKEKAKRYPASFALFKHFVKTHWVTYASGQVPKDFEENPYFYWGKLYSRLPNSKVRVKAVLSLLCFHMADSLKPMKNIQGEPYTLAHHLYTHPEAVDVNMSRMFLNTGAVMANWFTNDFVFEYPFLEKVSAHQFEAPIFVVSGSNDEISPPEKVKEFAKILKAQRCDIVEDAGHLVDSELGKGDLAKSTADILADVVELVKI